MNGAAPRSAQQATSVLRCLHLGNTSSRLPRARSPMSSTLCTMFDACLVEKCTPEETEPRRGTLPRSRADTTATAGV
jgi:hypothetical protein